MCSQFPVRYHRWNGITTFITPQGRAAHYCIGIAVLSSFRRFLAVFTHDMVKTRWHLGFAPTIQSRSNLALERRISSVGRENHDFHVIKREAHGSKGAVRG